MKLLHLSDLHLGKRVNDFSMIEDQSYILQQILQIADAQRPDGVLIAGDVYDKAVPSAEAVTLFDAFLTALAQRGVPAFVISGNHDSAERIAFGAHLMGGSGVYLSPVYRGAEPPVALRDGYGPVYIHLLPFLKPAVVRHAYPEAEIGSYNDALAYAVAQIPLDKQARNVLVAHQFVTGAVRCESEEVSVGGLDNIDVSVFSDFDYVALGHIHSPQKIGGNARYCGTPLKYSFSEAGQQKSVTVVELREKGHVEISAIPLSPLRDLRQLRGAYAELTALERYKGTNTDDYIHVTLTDEEDVVDAVAKLRTIYPHITRLDYDNRRTRENKIVEGAEQVQKKSPLTLLEEFYKLQNNQEMSAEQRAFAQALIGEIWEEQP